MAAELKPDNPIAQACVEKWANRAGLHAEALAARRTIHSRPWTVHLFTRSGDGCGQRMRPPPPGVLAPTRFPLCGRYYRATAGILSLCAREASRFSGIGGIASEPRSPLPISAAYLNHFVTATAPATALSHRSQRGYSTAPA